MIKNGQILATVDMGSNSFRLEMARLEHGQLVRIDYYKEPVRLGAGLDENGNLTPAAIARSIECLERFAERLRGLAPYAKFAQCEKPRGFSQTGTGRARLPDRNHRGA